MLLHLELCRYRVFCFVLFFYKLKICGHPALSKSNGTIFPTALAHFAFLCRILPGAALLLPAKAMRKEARHTQRRDGASVFW